MLKIALTSEKAIKDIKELAVLTIKKKAVNVRRNSSNYAVKCTKRENFGPRYTQLQQVAVWVYIKQTS